MVTSAPTVAGVRSRVRPRLRTQWVALGAALVVLAGVVVAWALSQAAHRVQVVQVARGVRAGEVIAAADLTVVGVAYDAGVRGLVPAASLHAVTGHVAAVDLDVGSLLQHGMWHDAPVPGPGEARVGVLLRPGRAPAGLSRGDLASAVALDDTTPAVAVRVLAIDTASDGTVRLTLAVPVGDAPAVARLAAQERLILIGADG